MASQRHPDRDIANRHRRFWLNYGDQIKSAPSSSDQTPWRTLMADVGLAEPSGSIRLLRPMQQLLPVSLATLAGHRQDVTGAVVLANGAGFLSWSEDGTLRLWAANGSPRAVLEGHRNAVSGAAVLADGTGFLSWSDDGTLRLWSADGTPGAVLEGHEDIINGAAVLADGTGFLSWSYDGKLRLWSADGTPGAVLEGHQGSVRGAAVLADGTGFLSWSQDGTLRLWTMEGREHAVWICPTGAIRDVVPMGSSRFLVISGRHILHVIVDKSEMSTSA